MWQIGRAGLVALLGLSLSGCATVPRFWANLKSPSRELAVRPISLDLGSPASLPRDRAYVQAKAAIQARDYPLALDLLQVAREQVPNDGRVLNAMAVVYDKLGRFDLSARYYGQALSLDPNSSVVLANRTYSGKLQGAYSTSALAMALAPPAQPADRALVPAESPPERAASITPIRIARGTVTPVVTSTLVGSPLVIINAAGRPGAQEPVRRYLAQAGWTVTSQLQIRSVQPTTHITYAPEHRRVAEALARTLPFGTTLAMCSAACAGIELVVGGDAPANLTGRS